MLQGSVPAHVVVFFYTFSYFTAKTSALLSQNFSVFPSFVPGPLLQKLSGLNSIKSETAIKKLRITFGPRF